MLKFLESLIKVVEGEVLIDGCDVIVCNKFKHFLDLADAADV